MKWIFSPLLLTLSLVFLAGCGSKEPVKTSVKGRVWYHGGPLKGGSIVFVPDTDRGNSGPLAKGTIRDDGTFTFNNDSLTAGWYRVAIAARPATAPSLPTAANLYPGPPSRYRNPQLSGLAGEVRPNNDNVFAFDLEDAPER